MDRDSYQMLEEARRASVNRDQEEARRREMRLERKKKARRAYRIQGAVLALAIMIASYITVPKVVDIFTDYSNPSFHAGYSAVGQETHRTQDNEGFWFDYGDIAWSFEEGQDFDSFVYGCYQRIAGSGSGRTLVNMDDLFWSLHNRGLTEYSSFTDYCLAHGFSKEKDGKLVVDMSKYSHAAREYLKDLKAIEQHQEDVEGFRR